MQHFNVRSQWSFKVITLLQRQLNQNALNILDEMIKQNHPNTSINIYPLKRIFATVDSGLDSFLVLICMFNRLNAQCMNYACTSITALWKSAINHLAFARQGIKNALGLTLNTFCHSYLQHLSIAWKYQCFRIPAKRGLYFLTSWIMVSLMNRAGRMMRAWIMRHITLFES